MTRQRSWLTIVIVLTILISLVIIYINQGPLPAYIDQPSSEQVSSSPDLPDLEIYHNDELALSFSVPAAWQKIQEGNTVLFVSTDGTRLTLEVTEYRPESNMVTQQSLCNEVAAIGGQCLFFQKTGNNSYVSIYQMKDVLTAEYILWDRTQECRFCFSCRSDEYETYQPLILTVFDSCKWDSTDTIPEPLILYYEPVKNFEFGVPSAWMSGVVNGSFISQSPNGSVFSVAISEDTRSPENISQIQYAQEMSSSHMDFYVKSYITSESQITAEAVYSQNGIQMDLYQYILFRSGYCYIFSLDQPVVANASDTALFKQCLQLIRFF